MQRPERIPTRFDQDRDAVYLTATGPWLVRCPRCDGCARVQGRRLVCASCSLVRHASHDITPDGRVHATSGTGGRWQRDRDRGPRDAGPPQRDAHYELWLRERCCDGEMLWAVNGTHLAYLERYVAATLREGSPVPHQRLHHRLPDWMKRREHRVEVLESIARLRDRLATADTAPA